MVKLYPEQVKFGLMPSATIDIVGTNPRQYTYRGGEELDEEIGAEGPSKDTRKTKIPWEKYKDLLYKHYMEEDGKLPDVMEIMKRHGLHATYQLGEKWKWKKYNQQGVEKLTPPRTRKSRSQNNLREAQEDEIVVASTELEVPSRDVLSLHAPLRELFTDRPLDEKCLGILKIGNSRDVSQCLRLCFHWCKEEIHIDDAEFPAPYGDGTDAEPDVPEDNYGCDVRIFIYLLHRYMGSSAPAEHDSWDTLAKQTVGFCPIKMLYTMSTLLVVVASNVLKLSEEPASPFGTVIDNLFSVAKLGVDEIDRWDEEKLLTEFCDEFQTILEDYANYSEAVSSAVRGYMALHWPALEMHEELEFTSDEDHHDDSFSTLYTQPDESMFQFDDLSM
ncbi:hypothetical protein EV127DRAFT_414157 [Xylaria flabelliformis]|nr:hypothetical protein EV127DRAFT_414157 [Xylaria flabelliformis]